jgi:hypothetical protein
MHNILFSRGAAVVLAAALAGGREPYPTMRPVEEYLMSRDAEISLARTAAPEAISRNATIMVMSRHGYEIAVEGTNGFVCLVERGWVGPFDSPEMWNPKIRGADCVNPQAARSLLPTMEKKTALYLAGRSKAEVIAELEAEVAKGELPGVEPGAMGYMMSRSSYLTDKGDHNGPHLMFFTPVAHAQDWGTGIEHSPVVAAVSYWFMSENPRSAKFPPVMVFAVALNTWSDGSSARH